MGPDPGGLGLFQEKVTGTEADLHGGRRRGGHGGHTWTWRIGMGRLQGRDARCGWGVTGAKRGHGLPAPSQPQWGPARRQAPSTSGPEGERRQPCNPGAPARGLLSSSGGSVPGPPPRFAGARPRAKISLGLVAPVALVPPPPTVTAQVRRAPQSHARTARRPACPADKRLRPSAPALSAWLLLRACSSLGLRGAAGGR